MSSFVDRPSVWMLGAVEVLVQKQRVIDSSLVTSPSPYCGLSNVERVQVLEAIRYGDSELLTQFPGAFHVHKNFLKCLCLINDVLGLQGHIVRVEHVVIKGCVTHLIGMKQLLFHLPAKKVSYGLVFRGFRNIVDELLSDMI